MNGYLTLIGGFREFKSGAGRMSAILESLEKSWESISEILHLIDGWKLIKDP